MKKIIKKNNALEGVETMHSHCFEVILHDKKLSSKYTNHSEKTVTDTMVNKKILWTKIFETGFHSIHWLEI